MSYGITSESQIIDVDTIRKGCNELKSNAGDFSNCAKNVKSAGEDCTKDTISVDGMSLEPTIVQLSEEISNCKTAIENLADQIISEAETIYNAQRNELAEYKRRLEEQQSSGYEG